MRFGQKQAQETGTSSPRGDLGWPAGHPAVLGHRLGPPIARNTHQATRDVDQSVALVPTANWHRGACRSVQVGRSCRSGPQVKKCWFGSHHPVEHAQLSWPPRIVGTVWGRLIRSGHKRRSMSGARA